MLGNVSEKTAPAIDGLMGLCHWFDPGQCHVIVGHATQDAAVTNGLQQKYQGRLEFLHDPPNLPSPRTWKYADIRNHLLLTGMGKNPTYLMPADLDGRVKYDDATLGGITNAIAVYGDRWDGMAFSSTTGYYDWWALRCRLDSPNYMATDPPVRFDGKHWMCHIQLNNNPDTSDIHFVPVASAFDGMALYKTNQIGACRYDGHQDPSRPNEIPGWQEDCEHVAFNNCLVKQGKKFMLSSLAISGR